MAMCNSFHQLLFLWLYILCLCQYSILVSGTTGDYFDAKRRLMRYLTNDSEIVREIRPARDNNTSVNIKVRMHLHEIANVDEKNQLVQTTVWLGFDWNNPFLTWNPAEYGGIESVHANHELFWVPDVALFNEARLDDKILYKRLVTKLVINKDGDCTWNAPATLLSQCKIDVSRFPFDEQECQVTIGSWTYSVREINTTYFERHADRRHFIKHGEWDLESALLHNRIKNYGANDLQFSHVTLTLKIKRRSLYISVYVVAPSAVISVLAPLSFTLPTANGERITLLNGVLVANSVYMLIVSSMLPETSDAVPILGKYLLGNIITIVLCLCATFVSLGCYDLTCPMKPWLWKFFQYLNCKCQEETSEEATPHALNNQRLATPTPSTPQLENEEPTELRETNEVITRQPQEALTPQTTEESNTEDMRSSRKEKFAKQWKIASKVLDSVFFILFFLVYVILIIWFYSA